MIASRFFVTRLQSVVGALLLIIAALGINAGAQDQSLKEDSPPSAAAAFNEKSAEQQQETPEASSLDVPPQSDVLVPESPSIKKEISDEGLNQPNRLTADGTVSVMKEPESARTPSEKRGVGFSQNSIKSQAHQSQKKIQAEIPPDSVPGGAATDLIAHALRRVEKGADALLYERPLSLIESLERSGDRSRRLLVTQSYWKLSGCFLALTWVRELQSRLELVAPGSDPYDRAAIDAAIATAMAEGAEIKSELIASQYELAELARLPPGEAMPWPIDHPLTSPYQTHFGAIFAARLATMRIRMIDRTLPSKHEAIESHAAAFLASATAMQLAETDHARGMRTIESVIVAAKEIALTQHEIVRLVKSYNVDIAEYVVAVVDASVPDDRFASMLISSPVQWRTSVQGVSSESLSIPVGGSRVETVSGTRP